MDTREQEVRSVIESGLPLRRLKPHFSSVVEAMRHYGAVMNEKHAYEPVHGDCELCRRRSAQTVEACTWGALVGHRITFGWLDALHLVIGHIRFGITYTPVVFATSHPLCLRCSWEWRFRRKLATVTAALASLFLVAGLFVSILAGPLYLGLRYYAGAPEDATAFGIAFLLAFGAIVAAVLGKVWEYRLRTPKQYRAIGRWPFRLQRVDPVGK